MVASRQSEDTYLTFENFQAHILVDGKEVPHYSIEVNKEKKEATCWIASQTGQVCFEYVSPLILFSDSAPLSPFLVK